LDTRRGSLMFRQVVDSMGAETAFRAFQDESEDLKNEINERLGRIEELEGRLKLLTDKKRSKTILNSFRNAYAGALAKLNRPAIETSKVKITSRPDVSGSGGPRSLLAYYGAIWQTCYGDETSFAVPLVIDSPNQQGQDVINMPKVLEYLTSDLPSRAQVIVGSETDTDLDFDQKLILEDPYKLLKESEFSSIRILLDPLVQQMHDTIQSQNIASEAP
jgi:hypothetical protein